MLLEPGTDVVVGLWPDPVGLTACLRLKSDHIVKLMSVGWLLMVCACVIACVGGKAGLCEWQGWLVWVARLACVGGKASLISCPM